MTLFRERRAAFAVVDFFLVVVVVLPVVFGLGMVACSIVWGLGKANPDPTVTVNEYIRTVEHDGHWFVGPRNSGGLLHHPGCPCGKAEEEK